MLHRQIRSGFIWSLNYKLYSQIIGLINENSIFTTNTRYKSANSSQIGLKFHVIYVGQVGHKSHVN